jgi:hypothetical protein
MTLSIITLEKTKELLNSELQEVSKQIQEVEKSTQELGYKNFKVQYIRQSWKSITEKEVSYDVTLKHVSQDVDVTICTEGIPDRISWGGHSWSNIKEDEFISIIHKGKDYIEAVHEMLCMLEKLDDVKKVLSEVIEIYTSANELREYGHELELQIHEVSVQIGQLKDEEYYQKALELFKDPVYLANSYDLTNRTELHRIRISLNKKGNPVIEVHGKSKTLTQREVIQMYHWANKWNTQCDTDWEKEYNDPTRKTYYKYPNMFISIEECTRQNYEKIREKITEEEYNKLRRG